MYVSAIFVKPLRMSIEQVNRMHDYLEKQVDGLIFDFIYSNKTSSSPLENNLSTSWYYDYARYIKTIQEEFMYMMTMIVKSPIEVVRGGYQLETIPKKMDRKSIQWSLTIKGMTKNAGSTQSQFYMNKKKFSVYQTRENEWIKNIIVEWKHEVGLVKELLKKDYLKGIQMQKIKGQELEKRKEVQRSFIGKTDVAVSTKKDISSKIFMVEKELNDIEKMSSAFEALLDCIRVFESKIYYFSSETFLKEVSRGNRKPVLKKPSYLRVDTMY